MSWFAKKRVLVPVDFSEQSRAAAEKAVESAVDAKQLHLVHVLIDMAVAESELIWTAANDAARKEHAMEQLHTTYTGSPFLGAHLHVVFGDPGHEIIKLASEIGAELIVMPSHGRRGIKRLLLGSVAERVVQLAECPVLVLREFGEVR